MGTNVITADLDIVSELAAREYFDFIVVGSGLGGGILAQKLVEGGKRVLLIEKGGLKFSTHCLNTSRPHWQVGSLHGPSQDNDVVFNATKEKVQTAEGSDAYVGGPVYCLGGRSTVWGLFVPRIKDKQHKKYFPERVSGYLEKDGYENALKLLTSGSQSFKKGKIYPQQPGDVSATEVNEIEQQVASALDEKYAVELAPIATELKSPIAYVFPQGAYSTVDTLLDKTYAKDPNLTILMSTEVLSVSVQETHDHKKYDTNYLTVRTLPDRRVSKLAVNSTIILCAGTLGSASIALNSGLQDILPLVGKGLTDHEIWGVRFARETSKDLKAPLKVQSHIKVCDEEALLNVVVNANTFFGRASTAFTQQLQHFSEDCKLVKTIPDKPTKDHTSSIAYDLVNVTLEFGAELLDESEVLSTPTAEPVVRVLRSTPRQDETSQKAMQKLATNIRNKILEIKKDKCADPAPRLSLAGFGAVAHEVGTMRMGKEMAKSVVNEKYQVHKCPNLYVCDLSIFPYSFPANPSLTLAALALQLAKDLLADCGTN